jgi:C-terminal processing protease CtpA/Prc
LHVRAAFLIDAHAMSYSETMLALVERYQLAELVGEPTGGTNGVPTTVPLPGGYYVNFTGMKVLKHNGARHHGIGILPTVPVSPTIAGIAAGRDEQLEKAIELVSR